MNRTDRLLAKARAMGRHSASILCQLPDGTQKAMGSIEALRTGARFIRSLDGGHGFDELYAALLGRGEG